MNWDDMQCKTLEHFENPLKGDRFHEMYSFWVYVWDILSDGTIITHEASPPCELPKDAKIVSYPNKEAFRKRFEYQSPKLKGKFSVQWCNTSDYHAEDEVLDLRPVLLGG